MTYWALNAVFLGVVAVTAVAALLVDARRQRQRQRQRQRGGALAADGGSGRGRRITSAALVALILLVMTAVFDNVMIGIGLVGYDASKISGVFVGIAPLEDFSYAVAALILLPSLWLLLGGRSRTEGES